MKGNQKDAERGYYRIPRRIFLLEDQPLFLEPP
jgi:hypothetical protein